MLRRTPLRVKLVTAVLALVAVALVLISVASTLALRSFLIGQVDEQLHETVQEVESRGLPAEGVLRRPPLPSDIMIEQRLPEIALLGYDLARYEVADLPPLPENLAEAAPRAGDPYTAEARNGSSRWRVMVTLQPDGSVLTVAANIADVDSAVGRLVWAEVLIGTGVLLLLAALGVAAVRTSLRPLHQIEQTAGAIAAGDLTRRVPDPEPGGATPRTEVGRLARALNTMLAQIEAAFAARAESESAARSAESRARQSEERMRQFVADASHELRTPLTTIRGFAELYRQGAVGSPEETARLVQRIEDEAARMGLLVQDLLLLARLDQERPLEFAPVELSVIVSEAVQAAQAVHPHRPITLEVLPEAARLVVTGDDARLRQVVGNLLGNAMTHTPAEAAVTVRLRAEPDQGVIEVADQGPGLTPEQAERVFERFYRVDAARSRQARAGPGGSGLGLAIVAALVAAHGGGVEVESELGHGATFRVRLPIAPGNGSGPAGAAVPPGGDHSADFQPDPRHAEESV